MGLFSRKSEPSSAPSPSGFTAEQKAGQKKWQDAFAATRTARSEPRRSTEEDRWIR